MFYYQDYRHNVQIQVTQVTDIKSKLRELKTVKDLSVWLLED